jgi:hypothetical protein
MKLKMGIIHVEKQEIWEPPELTRKQYEELNKYIAERLGWHRTITSQERAELWNDGKGIDHPNVIEGEYEEVKQCRALPGS